MYAHHLDGLRGDDFDAATSELSDEILALIEAGRFGLAATKFARAIPVLPEDTSVDERWRSAAHYGAALLLGRIERYTPARHQMLHADLTAGGDHDLLLYPDRAAMGARLRRRQQQAIAVGAPSALITSMPKSASAFVSNAFADLHGVPVFRVSCQGSWVFQGWAEQLKAGGAVTHEHYPASNGNVECLVDAGVKRVFVQVRDPRATLWSLYHHGIERIHVVSNSAHPDAMMVDWYKSALRWLVSWKTAAEQAALDVHFIHYDDVRLHPARTLAQIGALSGSAMTEEEVERHLDARAGSGKPENLRLGDPDDWRRNMPQRLQDEIWDKTPEEVRTFLGLSRHGALGGLKGAPVRESNAQPASTQMSLEQPAPDGAIQNAMSESVPAETRAPKPQATSAAPSPAQVQGWTHTEKDIRIAWSFKGVSVVAFAGPAHALGSVGNAFEFMHQLHSQGADAILMRDRNRAWYQRGVVGVGPSAASVVGFVRGLTCPNRRVITMGNSMGGFAAILFGVLAGVDEVIAVAPQTFMDPENRAKHGITTFKEFIDAPEWNPASPYLDLAKVLRDHAPCKTRIRIFYGDRAREDEIHARHLAELPNVELAAIENCDHASVGRRVAERGVFAELTSSMKT